MEEQHLEQSFLAYPLQQLPFVVIALLIALPVHEFAHAYVAYLFGDPTAKYEGRLTLNPLKHLDPIGTLMIFLAGFGWAKPVPVNRFHLKNVRTASVLISLAGPVSNLILCTIFLFLYQWVPMDNFALNMFFTINIMLNAVLFLFNMFPFPPLDGYRIIENLLPTRERLVLQKYEMYGVFIFLLLAITPLGNYVFGPVFQIVLPKLLSFLSSLVFII